MPPARAENHEGLARHRRPCFSSCAQPMSLCYLAASRKSRVTCSFFATPAHLGLAPGVLCLPRTIAPPASTHRSISSSRPPQPHQLRKGGAFTNSLATDPTPLATRLPWRRQTATPLSKRGTNGTRPEKSTVCPDGSQGRAGLVLHVPGRDAEVWSDLLDTMRRVGADPSRHRFIKPSAGTGIFCDLLPPDRRDRHRHRFDQRSCASGLSLVESAGTDRLTVVGNPPSGYRAWLALAFLNHAATFASHIGMIRQ